MTLCSSTWVTTDVMQCWFPFSVFSYFFLQDTKTHFFSRLTIFFIIEVDLCIFYFHQLAKLYMFLNSRYNWCCTLVGYTMVDIEYQWAGGRKSIGMGPIQLPQFTVLGHRHTQTYILLSTGTQVISLLKQQAFYTYFIT